MRLVEVLGELFNRVESMWSRWKTYLDHNGRMKFFEGKEPSPLSSMT